MQKALLWVVIALSSVAVAQTAQKKALPQGKNDMIELGMVQAPPCGGSEGNTCMLYFVHGDQVWSVSCFLTFADCMDISHTDMWHIGSRLPLIPVRAKAVAIDSHPGCKTARTLDPGVDMCLEVFTKPYHLTFFRWNVRTMGTDEKARYGIK